MVLLLAAGGLVFYVYRTVNNVDQYREVFVDYEAELKQYEDSKLEDFISYDRENLKFHYQVPLLLLYRTINADSLSQFLGLPEELTIKQVGLVPDIANKKVDIYLDVSLKNLIDTCLLVKTDYMLSKDRSRLEMRYNDYYLLNDEVTEKVREYVHAEKGDLMFTHSFPRDVEYFQVPDFRVDCVSDVSYENGCINAVYDLESALISYLEMNPSRELKRQLEADALEYAFHAHWPEVVKASRDMKLKLEAIDQAVEKYGIAH